MSVLYNIIILPIEIVIDTVFTVVYDFTRSPGMAISCVSLLISLLTLPLYLNSDRIQEIERDKQKEMSHWVEHIRKTFKGDERTMMLSTYYRQQNYHPFYAVRGSLSLLLQIPFFIAAYHYLSNLEILNLYPFLFIKNLGEPDALLTLGSFTVNVLPVAMTVINIISGAIYTRGFPIKAKLQLYILAGLFLVILYNSPAGLVLYWTLNNIFSLLKNIVMKYFKKPKMAMLALPAALGMVLIVFTFYSTRFDTRRILLARVIAVLLMVVSAILIAIERKHENRDNFTENFIPADNRIYIGCSILLTVLFGIVIPSSVISASPGDFINVNNYINPLKYVFTTFCIGVGFFVLWMGIFYCVLGNGFKLALSRFTVILSGIAIADYMLFGKNLGYISPNLIFDTTPQYSGFTMLINLLVLAVIIALLAVLTAKKEVWVFRGILVVITGLIVVSSYNIMSSAHEISIGNYKTQNRSEGLAGKIEPIIPLSQNGKNVIVFMLDRAVSGFIPYIFNEKPELKDKFEGFTYYPNTLSFGFVTTVGSPPLFGGYDYTPVEINKRDDVPKYEKQNEAITLMPILFSENNYKVTVCDPPYANYRTPSDLTIYDKYPGVNAYITEGAYTSWYREFNDSQRIRNFFCYSVFKSAPVFIQPFL